MDIDGEDMNVDGGSIRPSWYAAANSSRRSVSDLIHVIDQFDASQIAHPNNAHKVIYLSHRLV